MNNINIKEESADRLILAVVSAYGIMSEPESRHLTVIKAGDAESLKASLMEFLRAEMKRALNDAEIMETLETLEEESALAQVDLSEMSIEEGGMDVVPVMDLSTDYHLEYAVYENNPGLADAEEFVVMVEKEGPDEFASVMMILDRRDDAAEYVECSGGAPVYGSQSEIAEQLLSWDRVLLKAFS